MKRLKPEKKRFIVSIIAGVLILTMILGVVAPFLSPVFADEINATDIAVEANIGFDGNIKVGDNQKTEFRIKIKNNSDFDFKGSVNIPLKKINNNYENIKANIELNSKSEKELCFVNSICFITSEIKIVVKDEKNKTIKEIKAPIRCNDKKSVWFGFLSNSPEKLTYLKGSFFEEDNFFINLDKNNFPKNYRALDNLNVIICDDFNFSALSEEQKDYLKAWIKSGGVFVGSEDFENELEKYENKKEDKEVLKDILSYSSILSQDELALLENISVYEYGLGRIYFNNFSLLNSQLVNSASLGIELAEIQELLKNENNKKELYLENYSQLISRFSFFNEKMPRVKDITIIIIYIVIFLYFIFIGFVLYFILKKKDKLKKALWLLPSSALGLTILIFICSFSTIYKRPQVNAITLFEQNDNTFNMSNAVSALAISSLDKGDIKIELPKDYDNWEYNGDDYGYQEEEFNILAFDKIDFKAEKGIGEENYLTVFDNAKWNEINVNTIHNENEFERKIDIDIRVNNGIVKGKLTNNTGYDLQDIVVCCQNGCFVIEKLKKEESVEIGEGKYICDIGLLNSNTDESFSKILTDEAKKSFKRDDRIYELERKQDIVNYIIDSKEDVFYVVGFNADNIVDNGLNVNGKEPIVRNTNVFSAQKKLSLEDFEDGDVLEGFIQPTIENGQGNIDYNNNLLDFYDTLTPLVLGYEIPQNIIVEKCSFVYNPLQCSLEILNYQTMKWEKKEVLLANDINSYYDEDNKIKVKVTSKGESRNSLPQITLEIKSEEGVENNA